MLRREKSHITRRRRHCSVVYVSPSWGAMARDGCPVLTFYLLLSLTQLIRTTLHGTAATNQLRAPRRHSRPQGKVNKICALLSARHLSSRIAVLIVERELRSESPSYFSYHPAKAPPCIVRLSPIVLPTGKMDTPYSSRQRDS